MCFFKKTIKSALPAFLFFVLTFSGCSNLEHASTSSVTFTFNASRLANTNSRSADASSQIFIDVELAGDHEDKQTLSLSEQPSEQKEITVTFTEVPVSSSVYIKAKIYTVFENEKVVLYQGKSESKEIERENNSFKVTLEKAYNFITETESAYIVTWPVFTNYKKDQKLSTNIIEFKNDDNAEEFAWNFDKLYEYQKARITLKSASQNTGDNKITFHFFKNNSASWYAQDDISVTSERTSFEFEIPQGIKNDSIYITNKWILEDVPENGHWASDFNCSIEKIEFIKDASLIDPSLNQVTKTTSTYTVKNPVLQNTAYTEVYKNNVTFDSISGIKRERNPFSAAYWEFEDLEDYDKITIRYKCDNPNETGMKFVVKGFVPRNLPESPNCKHGADLTENKITLEQAGESDLFTCQLSILLQNLENDKVTAIEFQNDSYDGDWDDLNFGAPWTLQIEEIMLEKLGAFDMQIDIPADQDITVGEETITGGTRFIAPEGFTSYVWKLNGTIQTEVTGNIFEILKSTLPYGRNDVSLLVSDGTNNYSWQAQVYRPLN